MRIGLVGVGRWGSNYLPLLAAHPSVELAGVCDLDSGALRAAERFGAPAFGHVATLLASGIDAVVLATPPETHAQLAVLALSAGLHVLVEKPIATTIDGADAVVAAAIRARRVCAVGHLTLRHDGLARGSDGLRSVGRVERVSAERTSFGALHSRESALFGLAVHDVATLLGPLGLRPQRVKARSLSAEQPDQAIVIDLALDAPTSGAPSRPGADRVVAEIRASRLGPARVRRLDIVGTNGGFAFDELAMGVDLLARQVDAFVTRIAVGDVSAREARLGAEVVRVLASAQASLGAGGAWVNVRPASEAAVIDGR